MRTRNLVAMIVLGAALSAGAVGAGIGFGPPMVCHGLSIGQAKSLPWGDGAFGKTKGYSKSALLNDTIGLLRDQSDTIVRMETVRRAVVYLENDRGASVELLARLLAAGADAQAAGDASAGAPWLFDAAYFTACCEQMGYDLGFKPGQAEGVNGYLWAQHAMTVSFKPEMELGAALMVHPAMHKNTKAVYDKHIHEAARLAKPGSLLETNLAAHLSTWGSSLEKARAEAKTIEAKNASARK